MFPKKLESRLQERQAIGNLRHLPLNRATIDFYSNDYLGLRQNSELLAMLPQKKTMGSGGSRLLSGNTENMLQIEAQLALYYNDESA